jgi:hypothetical protein
MVWLEKAKSKGVCVAKLAERVRFIALQRRLDQRESRRDVVDHRRSFSCMYLVSLPRELEREK